MYSLQNCPKINMWNVWKPLYSRSSLMLTTKLDVFIALQKRLEQYKHKVVSIDNFFTLQSCLYSLKNPFFVSPGQKCHYFKMTERDTILYGWQGPTFFCDPKCCWNNSLTNFSWFIDSKEVYASKHLPTTIMSRGDTNYLLPHKTNSMAVT